MKVGKFDKDFLLSGKKLIYIFIGLFVSVILHNLIYGSLIYVFGEDYWNSGGEPFFFILTMLIFVYFLICVFYTVIKMIKDKTFFKKNFVIRVSLAVIAGFVLIWFLMQFIFINPSAFYFIAIVLSFIAYHIIRLIKQ